MMDRPWPFNKVGGWVGPGRGARWYHGGIPIIPLWGWHHQKQRNLGIFTYLSAARSGLLVDAGPAKPSGGSGTMHTYMP